MFDEIKMRKAAIHMRLLIDILMKFAVKLIKILGIIFL